VAQRKSVICPCHSWTYALSGKLRFASGFKGQPGFDESAWGLVELPVVEWHGLIFVNSPGDAGPLADSLQALDEVVGPYEPGPLAANEDGVYNFVTMVARGYQGEPVLEPGRRQLTARGDLTYRARRARLALWQYRRRHPLSACARAGIAHRARLKSPAMDLLGFDSRARTLCETMTPDLPSLGWNIVSG
jgi:hypothetical protein